MNTKSRMILLGGILCVATATLPDAISSPKFSQWSKSGKPQDKPPILIESLHAPSHGALLDGDHYFGDGVAFQNLTVWPVFLDLERNVGEYLTLSEASTRGVIEIRETGSNGSVNSIQFVNTGKIPILACAGTLVRGGKQDRVIADDAIIPGRTTQRVSVFCVERGRWDSVRQGQETDKLFASTDWKATKRVRVNAQYHGSQSAVWKQTRSVKRVILEEKGQHAVGLSGNQYFLSSTIASGTGSLFNALDKQVADARTTRRMMAAAVENHLRSRPKKLIGFAYSVDGEPVSVRTFAHPALFIKRMHSFIQTMCLEAEVAQRCHLGAGRAIHDTPGRIDAVIAMVRGLKQAQFTDKSTSKSSKVSKRKNGFGGNSICSVLVQDEKGEHWVVLTQDWTAPLEYGAEALQIMGKLQALGYTR